MVKSFKVFGFEDSFWLFESWVVDLVWLSMGGELVDLEVVEMFGYLVWINFFWCVYELLDLVKEVWEVGVYNVNFELEVGKLLIVW